MKCVMDIRKFAWLGVMVGITVVGGLVARELFAEQAVEPPKTAATQPTADETQAAWPPGLLMEGLDAIGARKPLDDWGFRIWGFNETGFTGRLTGGQDTLPLRAFEARRPNNLREHQLRLTFDRPYDNKKDFDVGGRIDGLFGGDAMLTHSPGLFEHAGRGDGDAWADLLQAYAQMWFKTGSESGLEVTSGKFVTTHGLEVIDAVGNPLYSHSYLFDFAIPFTHTGVKANYVFNSQFSAYLAVVEGWETFNDNNNAHSYMTGLAWTSDQKVEGKSRDALYLNLITGPEQSDDVNNYRTVLDTTFTHWWTGRLSQSVNADYGVEQDVSGIDCARWYGLAHYLSYVFDDRFTGVWRAEWFRDDGGSRTGFDGSAYETTLGLNVTPWPADRVLKNLLLRPELRWDFADGEFFGGDRRNQLTAAVDCVFKF